MIREDEALLKAANIATQHTVRFVHNLHDRTQWTATLRNWVPFYFAQEQAYRRMGRLLVEDPGAFRRYQMMIVGVSNLSANMQDGNGNHYIAFPGSGYIGKGVAEIMGMHGVMVGGISPAAFGGSMSSANVIFPMSQGVRPDLGPLAIVPASQLSSLLPELGVKYQHFAPVANAAAGALTYAVGGQQTVEQPVWEQLIPNAFVQRMVQATNGDDRAFNSSVMQAYQYLDYQQAKATEAWEKAGSKGAPPNIIPPQNATADQRQQFIDKVRNYVRALYVARAITGMVSPVSSTVEITNFGFPQKLNEEITKAGSVSNGMSNFILKYPDAVPFTVAQSYVPSDTDRSQSSGYSLASSKQGEDWVNTNMPQIKKYGVSYMWLMPQLKDTKYDPTIYNEQVAQGLRVKDTPPQFLTALYVAAGNNVYYQGLAVHEQALAAAGKSSVAREAEYTAWSQWVTQLEQQYPVWAENHLSGDKQVNRQQNIAGLQKIFAEGAAPNDEQSVLTKSLLEQYQVAASAYASAGQKSNYSKAQAEVNTAWIQYLGTLETQYPQLKPVIQGVFKEALKVAT